MLGTVLGNWGYIVKTHEASLLLQTWGGKGQTTNLKEKKENMPCGDNFLLLRKKKWTEIE